jgi:thymidylate kinase/thiamine kinase-like enzyme
MNNIQHIFNNVRSSNDITASHILISVQYFSNTDGSIRWIWPMASKTPVFLKFYHIVGLKASLFAAIIKLIFALRLQQLIFKQEKVQIKQTSILDSQNWALFTGTPGPNQKYVLYQHNSTEAEGTFTKIALTSESERLIKHETSVNEVLRRQKNISFDFPTILRSDKTTVSFLEKPSYNKRVNKWSNQHTIFLHSLSKISSKEQSFSDFDQIHQLSKRIKSLKDSRKKLPSGILKKLNYIHQSLCDKTVTTHFAHGDFTPWNMYSDSKGTLYVYDWELSAAGYPKGFDFFHYIIQNGVLTQQMPWGELKNEIDKHKANIFKNDDCEKYLTLYLLVNVLNYLEIYEKQSVWHTQIHWLLETWNMALSDFLSNVVNSRELIVLDTFDHLHYSDYSGLKLSDHAEKVSEYSDLDILMSKQTSNQLINFFKNHPLTQKVHIQTSSAMTKMMILTSDNQLLSIDNIHQLKRKSLEYMSASQLIKRPFIDRHGIKKMNLMDSLQFLGLFYGLNNASLPEKYKKYEHVLNSGNGTLDNIINKQFSTGAPCQKELYNEISKLPENQGTSGLKNKIVYVLDTIKNLMGQKGLVITFSGVDGAGKSTVIEYTKKVIEKKLRKSVVVIRHRPSVLPILSAWTKGKSQAEKAAAETLPRQGQNKSFLSSLFRFFYYYTDYLFGQFYIYCKYVLKGDVVLYDRYYFDFINDSLRSNITLPKWFLKYGYTFLLKPNLNFFLYADAKTILSRKKELDETTIKVLTKEYLDLFTILGSKSLGRYHSVENINLEYTTAHISQTIQAKLI